VITDGALLVEEEDAVGGVDAVGASMTVFF